MDKRHREIMGALVARLRHLLIGISTQHGFEPGDLYNELALLHGRKDVIEQSAQWTNDGLANHSIRKQGSQTSELDHEAVENTAYNWIIRLLTLRALEARGLIGETLRANQRYEGLSEKLYMLRQTTLTVVTTMDGGWWVLLKQVCAQLERVLPALFALNEPGALRPSAPALIACIELVGGKQPVVPGVTPEELDAIFADPDAIGWAYQFYQAETRSAINAKCKNGGKVASRAELVAKTQLFTESYMVQWLLQNSLGRSYIEAYPQSTLAATWPYALQPAQQETQPERACTLAELTLLDPCMGGGHFLRAAFDLFVAMYREQHPEMDAAKIAERVLDKHLFGIDLDPRSAQISALVLYLRAWEFVQAGRASGDKALYFPPVMHLATVPANLARSSLQRHLQRYPQDVIYTASLEKIFEDLEQSEMLGSLLHISAYLELALAHPQHPKTAIDPMQMRRELLEHIVTSCRAENCANAGEARTAFFRQEAAPEMHLLHLLEKRYAVIATNPPYLDSRDMDEALRKYIATHYPTGKRDLYAAFLLRCFDLCQPLGRVGVVTMQSWLFNRSFAELRAAPLKESDSSRPKSSFNYFAGILHEMCMETLVHLGARAFEGIMGEIVQCAMLTFSKRVPDEEFRIQAWRLVGLRTVEEKRAALLSIKTNAARQIIHRPRQRSFLSLAEAPIVYDLSDNLTRLLAFGEKIQQIAHVRQGLATADNARFTRCRWEILSLGHTAQNEWSTGRWFRYAKGGSYQKWAGLMWLVVDWEYSGRRIKLGMNEHNRPRFRDNAPQFAFQTGLTYTFIASGSFGTRILKNALFDVAGTSLFPRSETLPLSGLAAVTSSHVVSYLLRILTQDLKFNAGYVANTPLAPNIPWEFFRTLGEACIQLKNILVAQNIIEDTFTGTPVTPTQHVQAVLHTLEGWNEQVVCDMYQLNQQDRQAVIKETGTPAGWYPLIAGYDRMPDLSDELEDAPELPGGLSAYLATHTRVILTEKAMARVKTRLRALYKAGPHAKQAESHEEDGTSAEVSAGTHIAIPAETFLETLSIRMKLHPISVYWLLEELQANENVHCLPEERRLLEDRLSVLVLRLLGHRWPQQIEHFEPLPEWAEHSGIIPLVPCAGHKTLLERVCERLRAEEGAPGALEFERQVYALTGQHLEQWLRGSFFERHISQFKQRPIAWQLASTPVTGDGPGPNGLGRSRSPRLPAFACLIYYHACTSDILTQIRVQYIEPLLQKERDLIETTTGRLDKATFVAPGRVRELEEFAARLRAIEEHGFACHELQKSSATETLDRWSGNGQSCPDNRNAYLRAEAAWQIDINDGVRVNIAPLQLAGILARKVLHPKDAHKALSDRVRWRAEERRWVRAGKLPRCGWMEDTLRVPMPDNSTGQSRRASASGQRAGRAAVPRTESAR